MSKTISIDEMMSRNKHAMRGETLLKAAKGIPSWNPEQRTARFVMSAQVKDRDGDTVMTDGIQIEEFLKNPVSLWSHSHGFPIGAWEDLAKVSGRPKRLEGTHRSMPEGTDETADRIARMKAAGFIRACSIGFIPDWKAAEADFDEEDRFTGILFNMTSLMEGSICAIPANQAALAKAAKDDPAFATDLIEDALDNWPKNAAGIYMSREDFEAAYKTVTGDKKSIPVLTINEPEDIAAVTVEQDGETVTVTSEDKTGLWARLSKALGLSKEPTVEPLAPEPELPRLATDEQKAAATARAEAVMKRAELGV